MKSINTEIMSEKSFVSTIIPEPKPGRAPILTRAILWPFLLLTTLFAWWGLANNMTDTLLPAFKRIMSFNDGTTAWIQVVCYALGYGCFAIPGAMFMKRYTYKSGVLLGLGMFITGTIAFFPAKFAYESPGLCYLIYLCAILITFGGLSILETACNGYVCAMGHPDTAVRRLNFAQSFNPFGSLVGIILSQVFILSQLSPLTAEDRKALPEEALSAIQRSELSAVSATYAIIGLILLATWLAIFFSRMPNIREEDKSCDFFGTWKRLFHKPNYVFAVIALFFVVGSHIACWSFTVRYCMEALNLDAIAKKTPELLRNIEPVSRIFYDGCEAIGLSGFVPRTAEQAGATFYIFSQILFIAGRFSCTGLMSVVRPSRLLIFFALMALICTITVVFSPNLIGVYALCCASGFMSLMFPTVFSYGTRDLGTDTKMAGAGMVTMLCGGAILTQIQGVISDAAGSIAKAYYVPAFAFLMVAIYAIFICRKIDQKNEETRSE
ncbi:MAG: L-fucose:H+ symporter permease [Planctomycetia bacterium]|nr:L-fucose:H+ symporter permease [Planctomycetia bacterium]